MTGEPQGDFLLGDWLVQPALGRVSRDGDDRSLRPREMDLLVYLSERAGEVVRTGEIMNDVWHGVEVTNDSLYFSISQLRKALDDGSCASIIETIPKRGYRVVATVRPAAHQPGENPESGKLPTESQHPTANGAARRHGRRVGVAAFVVVVVGVLWLGMTDDAPREQGETVDVSGNGAEPGSIAVMPFIDLTPETDYTYFSDGITEEILNRLTRVPGLRVAARTSSFTFKDSDLGVVDIGRSLGVANLLEGSVRKEGDRVRISVQLIDATTGFQLWSDSFERTLTSVFDVQNEISRKVAEALKVTLTAVNREGGEPAAVASPRVLDEYLLGLEAMRVSSFESLRAAALHFESVLQADPSFDSARVQLAAAKIQLLNTGASSDKTLVDEADDLVGRVLENNPMDADAHRVLGIVRKWQKRWPESMRQFERALEIAPSDSESLVHLSQGLASSGRIPEARKLLDRAMRIDPFSVRILHSYAYVNTQFGAVDAARAALERAVALHPDNPNPLWMLGQNQVGEFGELALGLQSFLASAENDPSDYEIAAYVAATYASLEMLDSAALWVQKARQLGPASSITTHAASAIVDLLEGRVAEARETVAAGLANRGYRFMAHTMLTSPMLTIHAGGAAENDSAGRFLRDNVPGNVEYAGKFGDTEVDFQAMLAMSDLPRRWQVAIAGAERQSGSNSALQRSMDLLETVRIDDIRAIRDAPRGSDYLIEAEVRAIAGDIDGAFDMLSAAVEKNHVFLWQVYYLHNGAFSGLRDDPRWPDMIDKIRTYVAAERQVAAGAVGRRTAVD